MSAVGDDRPDAAPEAREPPEGPAVFSRGDRVVLEGRNHTGTVVEEWYAAPGGPTATGSSSASSPTGEPGWLLAVWLDVPGGNPVATPGDHVVVCRPEDLSPLQGGRVTE